MTQKSQVRDAADSLSNPERAELAVYLLNSLEGTHHWVDETEVAKRRAELDSGEVEGVSREEFRRLAGR